MEWSEYQDMKSNPILNATVNRVQWCGLFWTLDSTRINCRDHNWARSHAVLSFTRKFQSSPFYFFSLKYKKRQLLVRQAVVGHNIGSCCQLSCHIPFHMATSFLGSTQMWKWDSESSYFCFEIIFEKDIGYVNDKYLY